MSRTTLALLFASGLSGVGSSVHAQSLAAASAEAKKVVHEWPTSMSVAGPAVVATGPEAVIDRSKFDKVYAAAKALDASDYALSRGLLARQAMLAFQTEVSIAHDKATTKAEKALAGDYAEAQWKYELKLDPILNLSSEAWQAARADVRAILDRANSIYLGK
jgi:hypothetical protein